jgi:hypothetical protein
VNAAPRLGDICSTAAITFFVLGPVLGISTIPIGRCLIPGGTTAFGNIIVAVGGRAIGPSAAGGGIITSSVTGFGLVRRSVGWSDLECEVANIDIFLLRELALVNNSIYNLTGHVSKACLLRFGECRSFVRTGPQRIVANRRTRPCLACHLCFGTRPRLRLPFRHLS